ncbi:MAG TPA: DNA adenine methylase, partial [Candidatus Goldiibacteriota bacterium]|nr:DNA adenine methylase [Candidatus Goldiibacteriota bacterium]
MTTKLQERPIKAEPFLKWAGGKGQLLNDFVRLFPAKFNNYMEPFVGGGAVFFYLHSNGLLDGKKSVLIDSNKDLITAYKSIKDINKLKTIIKALSNGKYLNNEDNFYKVRKEEPKSEVEKTARLIYLNKTCFNGLYRVNSKGKFNVPFGRYNNPLICDSENLNAVNNALANTELVNGDFTIALEYAEKGDFVYFDPPYQPVSKTANFTGYTKNSFGEKDQQRLAEVYKKLDKRGCKLMLSNSDVKFIRGLYKGYRIEIVKAKRMINCKAAKRGA